MKSRKRASADMPVYWRNSNCTELTELAPAIHRYQRRQRLTMYDIELLRAYLRQWIMAPVWDQMSSPGTDAMLMNLRARIQRLWTEAAIRHWIETATEWGFDPL